MKLIPWYIRAYREVMMYKYIAQAVWQYDLEDPYPFARLPDWAVHYIARFLDDEPTEQYSQEFICDFIDVAEREWFHRQDKRKRQRIKN